MRSAEFAFDAGQETPSLRHRARSLNFDDQSIFTYANANKNWWGYA